jgi:hypothetical protein
MIIGRAKSEGKEALLLGLSRENVRRLQAKQPIRLRRQTHGDGVPEGWEIVIFFGETELSMKEELEKLGAIGPDTKVHVDPNL